MPLTRLNSQPFLNNLFLKWANLSEDISWVNYLKKFDFTVVVINNQTYLEFPRETSGDSVIWFILEYG